MITHTLLGPLGHLVFVRATAYLPLLVVSALLSADPHIGRSPVSTAIRGYRVRWRGLARGMSPSRQPPDEIERRDQPAGGERPRSQNNAALNLTAIELAVVAELNLDIARAHDGLAADPSLGPEARRAAAARASAIRERAESFHLQAQRVSGEPMLCAPSMEEPAAPRTVPERRRHDRRTAPRRRDGASAIGAPGGRERRTQPDRRKRERRSGVSVA